MKPTESQPQFSRADYMSGKVSHAEYYRQFVTPEVEQLVVITFGLERLKASTDPHLNDIPLHKWDGLAGRVNLRNGQMYSAAGLVPGDNSLASAVCVLKQAARMAIEKASAPALKFCHCGFKGTAEQFDKHISDKRADYAAYGWSSVDAHHFERTEIQTSKVSAPCKHCGRRIERTPDGAWINPDATGDDAIWRETCERHDTFTAEHEPEEKA